MALDLKHSPVGIERMVYDLLRNRLTTTLTEINLAWGLLDNVPSAIPDRMFMGFKEEIPAQGGDWVRVSVQRTKSQPLATIGESRDTYKIVLLCCTSSQIKTKLPSGAIGTANNPDPTLSSNQTVRAKSIAEAVNRAFQKYCISDYHSTYGVFDIKEGLYSDYKPRETNATGCRLELELLARGIDNQI
jgi:hypothetical protein